MKLHRILLSALAFAPLFAGCVTNVVDEPVSKTSVQDAHVYNSLKITDQSSNDITITGWTQDTISATASLSVWANNSEKAKEIANDLSFGWNTGGTEASLKVNYTNQDAELARLTKIAISSPQRLALNLETTSGDITVNNMIGDVRLTSTSGDMNIATKGHVTLESTSGDVNVKSGLGGTIDITSGDVTYDLTSKDFDGVNITSTSGDILLRIADGARISFDIETTSGDIDLNYGGTSTSTSSSPLRIDVNGGGKVVRLDATSGNIRVETLH